MDRFVEFLKTLLVIVGCLFVLFLNALLQLARWLFGKLIGPLTCITVVLIGASAAGRDWALLSAAGQPAVGATRQATEVPRKWLDDYAEAYRLHQETRAPLLIYFTMGNCPHCTRCRNEVWLNQDVQRRIAGQYVLCWCKLSDATRELWRRYEVKGAPTIIVATHEPKTRRLVGFHPAADVIAWLDGADVQRATVADQPTRVGIVWRFEDPRLLVAPQPAGTVWSSVSGGWAQPAQAWQGSSAPCPRCRNCR